MSMSRSQHLLSVCLLGVGLAWAGCAEKESTGGGTGGKGGGGGSSTGGRGGTTGGTGTGGSGGSSSTGGTTGGTGTGGSGGSSAGGSGGSGTGGSGGSSAGGSGGGATGGAGGKGGSGGTGGGTPDGGGNVPETSSAEREALDRACTPKFTLKQTDMGPKGMLFTEAVNGNAEAFVQQIGREVCRVLYRKAEEVRAANSIELNIRDYDGVAAKWGDIGDIGVEISTRHLQNVKNEGRDVRAEIAGILQHEMTHMYQNDDKPEGTFSGLANMYEGIGDAVRIRNGFPPAGAQPDKNGRWQDKAYSGQAFFWLYIDTAQPDFIYKLNATMKGRDGKAWQPSEIQTITGKSADQWWTEYQGAMCCRGNTQTCCK
jgi:hypothetical protein